MGGVEHRDGGRVGGGACVFLVTLILFILIQLGKVDSVAFTKVPPFREGSVQRELVADMRSSRLWEQSTYSNLPYLVLRTYDNYSPISFQRQILKADHAKRKHVPREEIPSVARRTPTITVMVKPSTRYGRSSSSSSVS